MNQMRFEIDDMDMFPPRCSGSKHKLCPSTLQLFFLRFVLAFFFVHEKKIGRIIIFPVDWQWLWDHTGMELTINYTHDNIYDQ